MENSNTNTNAVTADTVIEDFKASLFIVSLLINLVVLVTWLTLAMY